MSEDQKPKYPVQFEGNTRRPPKIDVMGFLLAHLRERQANYKYNPTIDENSEDDSASQELKVDLH